MSDDEKSSSSGSGLTFPQIAASALAAATAAILGSFLGVLGTIGGAAAASIISTVGSALYQQSLERTRDRVKERLVVTGTAQQKVAGAVARVTGKQPAVGTGSRPGPASMPPGQYPGAHPGQGQQTQVAQQAAPTQRPGVTGPGRAPTGPGGRGPVHPGTRPGGATRGPQPGPPGRPGVVGDRTVRGGGRTVGTQIHPNGPGGMPPTQVNGAPMPTSRIPDARVPGTPPGGVAGANPTARFQQGPGQGPPTGVGDAVTQVVAEQSGPRRKRIGKKGWLTMAALAVSIFAIGLFASFAVETAAGHPLSGGSSGTSVGSLFGQSTGTRTTGASESPTTTSDAPSTDDSSTGDQGDAQSDRSSSKPTSRSSEQQSDRSGKSGGSSGQGSNSVPQVGGGSSSNG